MFDSQQCYLERRILCLIKTKRSDENGSGNGLPHGVLNIWLVKYVNTAAMPVVKIGLKFTILIQTGKNRIEYGHGQMHV